MLKKNYVHQPGTYLPYKATDQEIAAIQLWYEEGIAQAKEAGELHQLAKEYELLDTIEKDDDTKQALNEWIEYITKNNDNTDVPPPLFTTKEIDNEAFIKFLDHCKEKNGL